MVDNLLQLGGKLLGGIVSQQGKNPTKQVGGNLLNGIVTNQQKKPVNQQLQVTEKPQVSKSFTVKLVQVSQPTFLATQVA